MAQLIPLPWLDLFHFAYARRRSDHPVEYIHAHDGIEFLYIHEGTGHLILNERYYRLEPPMLIFYQPFQLHSFHMNIPYTRSLLKIKLPLDERFAQLFPALLEFTSKLANQQLDNQVFALSEEQDAELRFHFRLFHETLLLTPLERNEQFYSFWAQFLSYFKTRIFPKCQPQDLAFPARSTQHIEKVMNWLGRHYQEEFHLDRLASEMHLSPSYLSRLFRKYTGTTLLEYLSKKRLGEAGLLLRTSSLSVRQIAAASGFSDTAYFCRSFKRKFGMTPLQFRNHQASLGGVANPSSIMEKGLGGLRGAEG